MRKRETESGGGREDGRMGGIGGRMGGWENEDELTWCNDVLTQQRAMCIYVLSLLRALRLATITQVLQVWLH